MSGQIDPRRVAMIAACGLAPALGLARFAETAERVAEATDHAAEATAAFSESIEALAETAAEIDLLEVSETRQQRRARERREAKAERQRVRQFERAGLPAYLTEG